MWSKFQYLHTLNFINTLIPYHPGQNTPVRVWDFQNSPVFVCRDLSSSVVSPVRNADRGQGGFSCLNTRDYTSLFEYWINLVSYCKVGSGLELGLGLWLVIRLGVRDLVKVGVRVSVRLISHFFCTTDLMWHMFVLTHFTVQYLWKVLLFSVVGFDYVFMYGILTVLLFIYLLTKKWQSWL